MSVRFDARGAYSSSLGKLKHVAQFCIEALVLAGTRPFDEVFTRVIPMHREISPFP